jgi:hypothetical protein
VRIFAACGTHAEIAGMVASRWGGAADSIELNFPAGTPVEERRDIVADIHRIPQTFTGFRTDW